MNKIVLLFTLVALSLICGSWSADAFGQTSTSTGIGEKISPEIRKVQQPVSVDGLPAQRDHETRITLLERQVAQLNKQVADLIQRLKQHESSHQITPGSDNFPDRVPGLPNPRDIVWPEGTNPNSSGNESGDPPP